MHRVPRSVPGPTQGAAATQVCEKVLLPRLGVEERACLRSALSSLGCEPVEAETAERASELLKDGSIELLVLDAEAEDWSAWARSLQGAMRAREGMALLLLVSSARPEGAFLSAVLAGALAYAVRPLSPDAVAHALRSLLEGDAALREQRGEAVNLLASEWKAELRRERRARAAVEVRLRELLRTEKRLHALLEATTSVMWTLTLTGAAVERSQSWESFTGKRFEDYQGYGYMNLIHPEDREHVRRDWAQVMGKSIPYVSEYRLLRHDGRWRQVRSRGVPVLGPDGRVREWVGWLVDITEERERELALRESEAQAQRAIRLRDEFLSIASHELKTPLTPLALKLQGMVRSLSVEELGNAAERLRADLEMAQRQVRRLAELIDGLLDVSRICEGGLHLLLEEVDLAVLLREMAARYEPQAQRAGCRLYVRAGHPVVGRWDRSRLEQVVSNLISNSLKYGAGRPVHLRVEASDGTARLIVRDEGIGIEPQSLTRIFQRFERAVSDRHYGGLGLGLYITRQIVEAFGGTVCATSEPGHGSTFVLELPRGDIPEEWLAVS